MLSLPYHRWCIRTMTSVLSCPAWLGLWTLKWKSRVRCPTSVRMWPPWTPFLLRLPRPTSASPSGTPSEWDPSLLISARLSPTASSSSPMANPRSVKMLPAARRTPRSVHNPQDHLLISTLLQEMPSPTLLACDPLQWSNVYSWPLITGCIHMSINCKQFNYRVMFLDQTVSFQYFLDM